MLIDFTMLDSKYKMQVNGVMHVGAHTGEEADTYDQLGWTPVYWVEADADVMPKLVEHVGARPNHLVVNGLCADIEGRNVEFHIANNEQSSSMLALGTHEHEHPEVHFVDHRSMIATTVDAVAYGPHCPLDAPVLGESGNFLNLDVQGAELFVLHGAKEFLATCNYVYCEVNENELYEGCALLPDLDAFLLEHGFLRVETLMTPHGWGDALYIRTNYLQRRRWWRWRRLLRRGWRRLLRGWRRWRREDGAVTISCDPAVATDCPGDTIPSEAGDA